MKYNDCLWSIMTINFVTTISISLACSCPAISNEEIFCNADTAVLGYITSNDSASVKKKESDLVTYPMNLKRILKGRKQNFKAVITGSPSGTCGVSLRTGLYLLTGSADEGRLGVNQCQLSIPYEDLVPKERFWVNRPWLLRVIVCRHLA